ncbi:ArsR/SmtB family transcription factor [Pseudonocardia lacus]|uniref:ArsR/SmtB family transcription factor n=1 Tax=Pseudonocardia lacus TaxID=2835865 RepID=UPI001BDC128D|nr:metalloregulator ArsR/SmtB family transcription factor [Pseudonocardia lacus]
MAGWTDLDEPVLASATALAAELADPIRLTTLQLLAAEGPHTMSRLVAALEVSAPRLGNHLARLRAAGLVDVEHAGRHAIYRIARPGLADVLAALSRYAGDALPTARPGREVTPDDIAHTCYDHAAGRLGVALLGHLVERGALTAPDGRGEELRLGPDAEALVALGVDPGEVDASRRKPATACLDRIHRLPHLGGALGARVLDRLVEQGLLVREEGTRVLVVTAAGWRDLPRMVPGFSPRA